MDWFRGRVNGLDAAGVPFRLQPQALSDMKLWVAPVLTRALCPLLPHCVRALGQKAYSGSVSLDLAGANYSPFG